ncbi:MAG: hypothetical protein JXA96_17560 [Sedimentisphaerales bacterium]|nr:hypothetical protein [Sedimentisphaerales bacterium]
MTEEMKIEELLNSYIDGELSVRERTEVKRMISNDPNIAVRLRKLQKCKTLVSALPVAQAPSNIVENVRASLEQKNLIQEKAPVRISDYREVKTSRRIFAAAAMFSLTALLVVVINMLMPTQLGNQNGKLVSANIRLSGKLELKANDLLGVQSVISNAIENSGFPDYKNPQKDSNRRIYTLNCSREGLSKILTDLEGNWDKISSAKLLLDTENFGESVEVASVTPSQISAIVNQVDNDQSIKVARDISFVNNLNDILNDSSIIASGSHVNSDLFRVPQPVLVSRNYSLLQQDNGEKTIQLRIILSR